MLRIDHFSISEIWDIEKENKITRFGQGHINDTWLLETVSQKYILQKVNNQVFRTKELVGNYEILVKEVNKYQENLDIKITPDIFKNNFGRLHYVDKHDAAWRLVEFINSANSYDISPNPTISYQAAKAIGNYQLFLNSIDPQLMQDTIVGFHNLPARMSAFEKSIEAADETLITSAKDEIEQILTLSSIVDETSSVIEKLPLRINHNDTKLNNVLYADGEVLVIDLDTVMHGHLMFDFGDMVRTFTSPAMEDEKDISKTHFRLAHFESLTKGYLEPLRGNLSVIEIESLFQGVLYIIYEQAIRFLTDYLNGNKYYKIAYYDHNLVRTRTQLKLLSFILVKRSQLEEIIRERPKSG